MRIQPDHENLVYSGRIDWSNPKAPVLVYPCSSVQMRFTGDWIKINIENHNAYWNNYIGYILDGKQGKILLPQKGNAILEIKIEQIQKKEHDFLLFKRQDACHEFVLQGVEIGEGERFLECAQKPMRRIEVYGDSVSAGEVSEAVDYVSSEDPEHNGEYSNSWYSYAWMTARKLKAEIHDIAQGGIALMDCSGWFNEPESIGMETVWDKIHYNPELGKSMRWDFDRYIPQVVIVGIGQNDSHPFDYMKHDYNGPQAIIWRNRYKNFLKNLRKVYPKATIICCTTLLNHDMAWDMSISQIVKELQDKKIMHYVFKRNGSGTPGHLRIPEAQEMADELTAFIEKLEIEEWYSWKFR